MNDAERGVIHNFPQAVEAVAVQQGVSRLIALAILLDGSFVVEDLRFECTSQPEFAELLAPYIPVLFSAN